MEQARPGARGVLHFLQKCCEDQVYQEIGKDPHFIPGEYLREQYYESQVPDTVYPDAREATVQALTQKYEDLLLTLDRDLWVALVDKSEGEAYDRVKGAGQGEGLWAYLRLYKWFSKTSSLGLIQRRRALLQPGRCKHDLDVSAEIENWEESLRALEVEEGNTEKMGDKSKIATVREILTPKLREYVDLREGELGTYSRFREAVMRYAATKRVEHNTQKRGGDDMDTTPVWEDRSETVEADSYWGRR